MPASCVHSHVNNVSMRGEVKTVEGQGDWDNYYRCVGEQGKEERRNKLSAASVREFDVCYVFILTGTPKEHDTTEELQRHYEYLEHVDQTKLEDFWTREIQTHLTYVFTISFNTNKHLTSFDAQSVQS